MEEIVEGYVEKIVFRNAENGYTVFSLSSEEDEITCVGNITFIGEGEFVQLTGNYIEHAVYGQQLKVNTFQIKEPEDIVAMERYLSSGAIKGIGIALAGRIIKRFKLDTFRIIEEEPERLTEVKGISERIAREIATQFEEKREMRSAMLFLQQYGISTNLAVKIFQAYKDQMYDVIRKNPYQLADDINGVGFKLADEIATKVGIGIDSQFRIKAGLVYILQQAGSSGHVYLPVLELMSKAGELLRIDASQLEHYLLEMSMEKRIVMNEVDGEKRVYPANLYYTEMNCARMLLDLNVSYDVKKDEIEKRLDQLQGKNGIILDGMQRMAVFEAIRNGLVIVTGGPGTGKTTTINTIIKFFEEEGMEILLAAPTGRAAKRMSETTGYEAQTIHRLLELNGVLDKEEKTMKFERNEINPLETDVLILDEMSMVDIFLMHALLKAVLVGTRVILVGDVNQLPSVGPGNVLQDIIKSNCFKVVELKKIFRQAAESDIIVNAHKINKGEKIALDNKSKEFFLLQRDQNDIIISVMIQLITQKLPKYVKTGVYDIQVITPMRKGELGVDRLNTILQQYLNPKSEGKKEKETKHGILREGDKVMQIKNNYQLPWEIKSTFGTMVETGSGVFNGDTGIVKEINIFAETVTVEFEEKKLVEYGFGILDELDLAYAITIHKSQGSEYPAIVLPILNGPRMLFNRNLLYTAVTRAKYCVTIVGSKEMVQSMIQNTSEQRRYSALDLKILEMQGVFS